MDTLQEEIEWLYQKSLASLEVLDISREVSALPTLQGLLTWEQVLLLELLVVGDTTLVYDRSLAVSIWELSELHYQVSQFLAIHNREVR